MDTFTLKETPQANKKLSKDNKILNPIQKTKALVSPTNVKSREPCLLATLHNKIHYACMIVRQWLWNESDCLK